MSNKNIIEDETPPAQGPGETVTDEERSIDWIEILSILWNSRKLIALLTASATVLSIVVSLILPESFKSTATILPETEKSKLAGLAGLSDLAAIAGVSVGGEGSLAKLYPTIIKSEAVLKSVIYREYETKKLKKPINLIQFWEIKEQTPEREYEVALKDLREELDVSLDNRTNVVTIALESREPQLSADIVNNITAGLDEFMRTKRTTNASEQRKWIETRLVEVKQDLERSENAVKEFREKNRRVADSPQLLLQQERLVREVQINSTIYTELKRQYEIVKIEEIKNIPIISVLDAARPATKKDKPRRSVIVLTWFFVSMFGSCAYVILRDRQGESIAALAKALGRSSSKSEGG